MTEYTLNDPGMSGSKPGKTNLWYLKSGKWSYLSKESSYSQETR